MTNQQLVQDIQINKLKVKQLERKLELNPGNQNLQSTLQILKKNLEKLVQQQSTQRI
ncbi:MAG: hypothetical protein KDD94_13410 [Calditrichaeota bacterium]|nr:hypothetical protein [Calditrichota bacterium]